MYTLHCVYSCSSCYDSSSEFDSHLNDVQTDLDALKDILRGDNYQFDTSALLNVSPTINFMEKKLDNVDIWLKVISENVSREM